MEFNLLDDEILDRYDFKPRSQIFFESLAYFWKVLRVLHLGALKRISKGYFPEALVGNSVMRSREAV